MKKSPITDHALLRYIERILGLDIEACKRHICKPEIMDAIKVGAASYTKDGITYIIEDKKVVTIIDGKATNRKQS